MKNCNKCKIEQPLTEFHNTTASKDGLSYICKTCAKVYRRTKAEYHKTYRTAHAEKMKEYQKKYRGKYVGKVNQYQKTYKQQQRLEIAIEKFIALKKPNQGKFIRGLYYIGDKIITTISNLIGVKTNVNNQK